jgi:hypothetical protein
MTTDLDSAVECLGRRATELASQATLGGQGRKELENELRALHAAIAILSKLAVFGVRSPLRVVRLPLPSTLTPSNEYRVICDNESDDRSQWEEVVVDDVPLRPCPGALVVEWQGCGEGPDRG